MGNVNKKTVEDETPVLASPQLVTLIVDLPPIAEEQEEVLNAEEWEEVLNAEEHEENLDPEELQRLEQQLQQICESLLDLNNNADEDPLPRSDDHWVNVSSTHDGVDEEEQPLLPSSGSQAPDGGWGWVVVASVFYINFMLAGLLRSYGVFLTAIGKEFPSASTSLVAWVPSVLGTASFVLSPLSSMLSDRFGCRKVVFVGGLFAGVGTSLCYYLSSVYFLIFAGGFVTGVGFTLCVTPCLLILGFYFCQRRSLANSLCAAGSAAGGLAMPHVIRSSLEAFTLGPTFLLLGGLLLTTCFAALFLTPLERPRNETPPRQGFCRSISLDLFTNPVFAVMAITVVLTSAGSPHVLYFIPSHAEGLDMSSLDASSLLSYAAFGDLAGRLILGWASDKQFVPKRVEYVCSIALTALVVLALPNMSTFGALVTFAILYGAATGSWQCLIPVLLADYHGTDKLGGAISLVRVLQGLTNLIIPPLTGFLRDLHGHFISSFYMMGVVMAFSAVVALGLPLAEAYDRKRRKNNTGAT